MDSATTETDTNPKPVRSRKLASWAKFIVFLCLTTLFILISGFVIFAIRIDNLRTPALRDLPKADGIVVWTGSGGGRLEAGAELLRHDKGERLLISGVNTELKSETIYNILQLPDALKSCCVDLDYIAEDTIGNARETASWAQALGYEHILLVTSAYHMPRAQGEIRTAIGHIRITPYPVSRSDNKDWYSDKSRLKRLAHEYAKLLLSIARGAEISRRETPHMPLPSQEKTP